MIKHQIDNDPDPLFMAAMNDVAKIGQRAESWVDGAVITNVIPVIYQRRGVKRRDPDGTDA